VRRAFVVAMVIASLVAIGVVQPRMASSVHKLRQRDDVFLLPPPSQLRVMTLGYRAAATDLLWADLILEYGLHSQEQRRFGDVTRYVDGILALEPNFPTLYDFIDTIIVYAPGGGTEDDARTARAYLERGTQERPYDHALWLRYGQFLAFLAPSFLKDKAEIDRWRVEGATAIARAVELGGDAQRSLAATSILDRAGERKAAIEHAQRVYALTDDPAVREEMLLRLRKLEAANESELAISTVERVWRQHYRVLSRGEALLVGPHRNPATCAGPQSYDRRGCARDWTMAVDQAR